MIRETDTLAEALNDFREENRNKIVEQLTAIAEKAKVDLNEVTSSFLKWHKEAQQVNLHVSMQEDEYIMYLLSMTNGDIAERMPDKPGTLIEFMGIGYYSQGKGKKGNFSNIVGLAKTDAGVYHTILTAYGEESINKRNDIKPFTPYAIEVAINTEDKGNSNVLRASVHKNTKFSLDNEVKSPTWISDTMEKRIQQVLSMYPYVPLSAANLNLSKLAPSREKDGNPGKSYIDITDLRVIQATIKDFKTGRRDDGIEWGLLNVVDSTFTPTSDHKFFTVWVDPSLVRKVGAGEDSYVKLLGTLEYDKNQKYVQMTACNILPIKLVPLQPEAVNLGPKTYPSMPQGNGLKDLSGFINISL